MIKRTDQEPLPRCVLLENPLLLLRWPPSNHSHGRAWENIISFDIAPHVKFPKSLYDSLARWKLPESTNTLASPWNSPELGPCGDPFPALLSQSCNCLVNMIIFRFVHIHIQTTEYESTCYKQPPKDNVFNVITTAAKVLFLSGFPVS